MAFAAIFQQGDAERDRILDLAVRLRWAFTAAVGLLTVAVFLAVPAHGLRILPPLAVSLLVYVRVVTQLPHYRRPELAIVVSWAVSLIACIATIALSEGPREDLFLLPAIANLAPALVFRRALVLTGAAITGAAVTTVALLTAAEAVADAPAALAMPVLTMVTMVNVLVAARDAELFSRRSAGEDPLTGVFNRAALDRHGAELALRASRNGCRIGVIVGDIDHFKAVNDAHGHTHGDAVLRGFAARLREATGSAGALYRFGGEEFVIVIADTDPAEALGVAQRCVEAVRATPIDGLPLTASFGVAVAGDGSASGVPELFASADSALYEAKAAGRDRVVAAAEEEATGAVAWPPAEAAERANGDRRDDHRRRAAVPVARDQRSGRERRSGRDRRRTTVSTLDATWFARDAVARAHIVDTIERVRPASAVNTLAIVLVMVALVPSIGWWPLVPLAVTGAMWTIYTFLLGRLRYPEVHAFFAVVLSVVAFGVSALLADGEGAAIALLANVYIAGAAAGGERGPSLALITVGALTTVVAYTATLGGELLAGHPAALGLPLALLLGAGTVGLGIGHIARHHRSSGMIDALTGVANRAALEARIDVLEHRALLGSRPVGLLVADLDHFKTVNDTHGHDTGDRVLVEFARRLETSVRGAGTPYRYGGEEFVVVLEPADEQTALMAAERLRSAIAADALAGVGVTVSVGVATWRPGRDPACFATLLARADRGLYAAKSGGRNRVVAAGVEARADDAIAAPVLAGA